MKPMKIIRINDFFFDAEKFQCAFYDEDDKSLLVYFGKKDRTTLEGDDAKKMCEWLYNNSQSVM